MVDSFPEGNSALMIVCAWLHHEADTQWDNKKYINMNHLDTAIEDSFIAACLHSFQSLQTNLRKALDPLTKNKSRPKIGALGSDF